MRTRCERRCLPCRVKNSDALEQVVAMHISQNNNTYRLPGEALTAVVRRAGHPATVQVAYQTMLVSAR